MPVLNIDEDALLNSRSLVKVVRDWRSFVATIDGTQKTPQEKPLLRQVGHAPNTYKYDADGLYFEKNPNKLITEANKTIKALYSRAQSTTVISPGEKFTPPTFKGLGLENIRVGVRFDALDTDMVSIKKIYLSDTGTVMAWHRNFTDPVAAIKAKKKLTAYAKGLFSNLEAFLTIAIKDRFPPMNEALARLKWGCKPTAQICIFEDNLASRLLAQVRAQDLQRHLLILANDNPELRPEKGYTVPISFYIPDNYRKKVWKYNAVEQATDRLKAESKNTSTEEYMLALFLKISQGTPAFSNVEDLTIKPNLEPLLKIANQLTCSSAYPFYLRIKPLLSTIDNDDPQLKDPYFWQLIFNCIPTDSSQEELNALKEIFPSLKTELEFRYLQAELNRFLLKPGTTLRQEDEAFLAELIKKHHHQAFYFLEQALISAAIRGHFSLVELITRTIDINAFGNTPYLAIEHAVANKHNQVKDLIFNKLINFDPTDTLEPFNHYLQSMLEEINTRLCEAGIEDDPQLSQVFQTYQTSILAQISPTNSFEDAKKIRTGLLKMLLYIESYTEHKSLINNSHGNSNSICEKFLQKSARTWDPKKKIPPKKKQKPPINFAKLCDILMTLAFCLVIAILITLLAALVLSAPKLALGLIFVIKACSVIFAGSFVVSALIAFGDELFMPCLKALSNFGLFSTSQKNKCDRNLVQALENNIRRETEKTRSFANLVTLPSVSNSSVSNSNNMPLPEAQNNVSIIPADISAASGVRRKDTVVLDIAPALKPELEPTSISLGT